MVSMYVEVLVVPECPHQRQAIELLDTALADIGLGRLTPTVTVITTPDEAAAKRFAGSPTFSMNGRDVLAAPGQTPSLSCRLYPGTGGLPDIRVLRQALKTAAAEAVAQ